MKPPKTFLGVGWKFPPTFDKKMNSVQMVSDETDIKEALHILLSTQVGERVMLPDFGCDLRVLAFENIDTNTLSEARRMIEMAILNYEPRITLENIEIDTDALNGVVRINVEYTIRKTNTRTNIVFPYYLIEGTELEK
jgi:phage baseplate assembly protein W